MSSLPRSPRRAHLSIYPPMYPSIYVIWKIDRNRTEQNSTVYKGDQINKKHTAAPLHAGYTDR